MAQENTNFIVGLDIGTSKVCAVVGVLKEDAIEIVGLGQSKSYGLRRGVIVNIEGTVKSISEAVNSLIFLLLKRRERSFKISSLT